MNIDLPPPVLYALGGVIALLVVASVIAAVLARTHPDKDYTELRQRIRTWWFILAGFFVAVAFHRAVAFVALALVSFVAFKEFFSIVPTRRVDYSVLLWAYLAVPVQYWWVVDRLVRHVHHLHPRLHVPGPADAPGARSARPRGSCARRHHAVGADDYRLQPLATWPGSSCCRARRRGRRRRGADLLPRGPDRAERRGAVRLGQVLGRRKVDPGREPEQDLGGLRRRGGDDDAGCLADRAVAHAARGLRSAWLGALIGVCGFSAT